MCITYLCCYDVDGQPLLLEVLNSSKSSTPIVDALAYNTAFSSSGSHHVCPLIWKGMVGEMYCSPICPQVRNSSDSEWERDAWKANSMSRLLSRSATKALDQSCVIGEDEDEWCVDYLTVHAASRTFYRVCTTDPNDTDDDTWYHIEV